MTSTPPPPHLDPEDDPRTRRVELIISSVLRIGVWTSLLLIAAGTVLFLLHDSRINGKNLATYTAGMQPIGRTLQWFLHDLASFQGTSLILIGLFLLIATPVLRVTISIFAFARQRDWLFVTLTAAVLVLLLISFFLKNGT
jgi:uncharacterized membrane protein